MVTAEGLIEIDLGDFFTWVLENYAPLKNGEHSFGVPRVNIGNSTLEIDFAVGSDSCPAEWAVPPKAVTQWKNLK